MKLIEGRIVIIYNSDDTDPSWTHNFIIVDNNETLIVGPDELPMDFEKNFSGLDVFVEVSDDVFETRILDENGCAKVHKKTMNIREALSLFGHSKEIKQRLSNGQIKINNKVIKSFDIDSSFEYDMDGKLIELAEFICDNGMDLYQLELMRKFMDLNVMDLFGSTTIHEDATNIDKFTFLRDYVLVSVSKREHYVFKNADKSKIPHKIFMKKVATK